MGVGGQVAFWIIAVVTIAAALGVVFLRNLVHAAFLLVLCFLGVAGIYVLLNADFLAVVQILIYVGAISILIIFAIMLTREVYRGNPFGRFRLSALLISGLMLAAFIFVALSTHWLSFAPPAEAAKVAQDQPTVQALSSAIFGREGFLLPFEIAAILLLTILIGVIALIKE